MPTEFTQQPSGGSGHITRLAMAYDGSGRRISKTAMRKVGGGDWDTTLVTHYTGIGTEVREYKPTNFARYTDSAGVEHCVSADPDYGGNASTTCPLPDTVKVAVSLPRGLGRYALQDAATVDSSLQGAYEFYLKDHLGSTRMVYGVGYPDPLGLSPQGDVRAAYDYRSFGEQLDLLVFTRKVTENFTGKERDDETGLNYFGARYLDPMLGMWISVDPARQFASPYLYAGNGYNPVNVVDPDGNEVVMDDWTKANYVLWLNSNVGGPEVKAIRQNIFAALESSDQVYHVRVKQPVDGLDKGTKGMYDLEYQAVMYDGTMENFFHELLAHAGLDEAIYERSGITLGNSNWFEPENNGREHFLDDEIRARGMGNSQTPANLMNIIEEYGNFYDLHYIDEVDVKE